MIGTRQLNDGVISPLERLSANATSLLGEFDITESLEGEFSITKSLLGEFDITEALEGEFDITESLLGEFDITESLEGEVDVTKENQDFTMYSRDTKEITFTVTLPGAGDTLVGTTVKWVLAKGNTVLVTKDNGATGGVTVTGATTFRVDIDPADTADLYGKYRHEAQVTDADGDVSTVARGLVTIENDLA